MILRSDNTKPTFQRYAAFVNANPSWPHAPLFRRRAENALWNDKLDDGAVLAFFANHKPTTAKGRYMLARALLAKGDRDGAAALVRYAWRNEDCSADVENKVLEMFGSLLTRADHKARMEQRFYADDIEAGMRAAERLGGNELAIAQARAAVIKKAEQRQGAARRGAGGARATMPATSSRACSGCAKTTRPEEAGKLILTAPQDPAALVDLDQWWLERRILVRKLLDEHDAQTAYRVARDAAPPPQGNYRVDQHFTAGWIALRFLHDPKTAAAHFAHIDEGTDNPHALARGGYWQGRAAEAMGQRAQAKAYYEAAAQYTATYYGQLARARLGLTDLGLRGPPSLTPAGAQRPRAISKSCARPKSSTRSTSATCWRRSMPNSAKAAPTSPAWRCWPKSPASMATAAPCCCSARRLWARPAARLLRLSDRRPARLQADRAADRCRRSPIRSRARKATSTRRSSRPPTPWG